MKNRLLVGVCFCVLAISLSGQDNDIYLEPNEFGFNATLFISNLLPFEISSPLQSSESLVFFKKGNGKLYFRSGLNLFFDKEETESQENESGFFGFKIGLESKSKISKKWFFHTGADIFLNSRWNNTSNVDPFFGNFESSENTTTYGIAGVYGVQWFLNQSLALSTEGYLNFSTSTRKEILGLQPSLSEQKFDSTSIGIIIPNSLYLSYYF